MPLLGPSASCKPLAAAGLRGYTGGPMHHRLYLMLSPTFISQLRRLLPPHSLLHEREDLMPFESDGLSAYRNTPDVVVL